MKPTSPTCAKFLAWKADTMLRITIAQLNLTVGDIEGNVSRMVAAAQ